MDASPPDTVCVQARLNHFNGEDSLVSRAASLEYAMWFDLLLTGLSNLRLPVPLGGTSLYVQTAALRSVGGWDPDNVTEDADLGIRLARRGWRAMIFDSTTMEEAPEKPRDWIGQRSRWIKGFMVTWLVHMRHPLRLSSDLGRTGALAINLMLLDGFIAFLLLPVFWLALLHMLVSLLYPVPVTLPAPLITAGLVVFPLGQFTVLGAAWIATRRRFGWRRALWAPLLWPYWQMGWFAAVKALLELFTTPNSWVKTEHGIGKNVEARRDDVLRKR